jgi:hypothetical protein
VGLKLFELSGDGGVRDPQNAGGPGEISSTFKGDDDGKVGWLH